jgi:hypothetical protein
VKCVGLVKCLVENEAIHMSDVIMLELEHASVDNDWVIMKPSPSNGKSEPFKHFVCMCEEAELPPERQAIGVKDFAVGLYEVGSSTKLQVGSTSCKVVHYEPRESPNRDNRSGFHVPLLPDGIPISRQDRSEDTIMINGGRVYGSCGAPYFAENGKVVAFHVRSLDDAPEPSSHSTRSHTSSRSHVSFSQGYVLCRLNDFVNWYRAHVVIT